MKEITSEVLTLPLITPPYDHTGILAALNTVKLIDVAMGCTKLANLIDKCITIEELYCTCRVLAPQLGIGRILTIRQLTKSVYKYCNSEWDKTIHTVDQLVHLIAQKWLEMDIRKIPISLNDYIKEDKGISVATDKYTATKLRIQNQISNIVKHINNGDIMINHFNMLLDTLLSIHYRHSHEMIDITMKSIIDICYTSSNGETRTQVLSFAFKVILDELNISKSSLFTVLDSHFKIRYLSNSIWNSRSHLNDVIYGLIGSAGNTILQSAKIPIYVDLSPNIPFKPMRTVRKTSIGKDQNQIMNKRQFQQLLSTITYSPFFNDIPEFIRQVNGKMTLKSSGVCVEEKLDGERSNFHLFRDPPGCECDICISAKYQLPNLDNELGILRCSFFSRTRTPQLFYGKYIGDPRGILTRLLNPVDFKHVENAILDGEMVAIDQSGSILGFSKVKEVASEENRLLADGKLDPSKVIPNSGIYCSFIAFDLLYFNDIKLQYLPLLYRKEILKRGFSSSFNQRFKLIKTISIKDRKGLIIHYNKVRSKKGEGLVVKSWSSIYKPGKDDKLWVKIKPEYLGHDRISCDVVIMGKVGNKTERGGGYLVGLKQSMDEIVCIGKLNYTNGIGDLEGDNDKSSSLWKSMRNQIDEKLLFNWKNGKPPINYKFGKTKPDLFVDFIHSLVLEVSGQRVVDSREGGIKYGDSHRLKDIRMKDIRHDKDVEDCDHFNEYLDMKLEGFIDYSNEESDDGDSTDNDEIISKRRKIIPKDERRLNIMQPKEFKMKSELFNGRMFCIFNNGKANGLSVRKFDLTHDIKEHGGEIVHKLEGQKQDSYDSIGNLIIIGDNPNLLPKIVKSKEFNVVNYQWVVDCIQSQSVIEPDQYHVTMGNEIFMRKAETIMDYFGMNENKLITQFGLSEMYKHWKLNLYGGQSAVGIEKCGLEKYHKFFKKAVYTIAKEGWELEKQFVLLDIVQNGGLIVNCWDYCDFIIPLGVNFQEYSQIVEIVKKQKRQAKIITRNELNELIREGIDIKKKWYLIAKPSSLEEKRRLIERITDRGGEVVEYWGDSDYIIPIKVSLGDQLKMASSIDKQKIVQLEDVLAIL